MKRKKQIKSEIQTSKQIANQVNMNFTQKILSKYDFGKLKNRFSTLIFRQYTSKAIDPINTKSNKELPVPFNILRITQCNSQNYSSLNSSYRVQEKQQSSGETSIVNKLTVVNLFNRIYEKYNKTLLKKVISDRNELYGKERAETKCMNLQQRQVLSEGVNKTTKMFSKPMGLLLKTQTAKNQLETLEAQDQFKNTQNLSSFIRSQRQSVGLFYDKNPQSELKTITFEQKSLRNRNINGNTNGTNNGINNGTINKPTNRITNILEKNVMNNRSPQIPLGENTNVDTVLRNERRSKVLGTVPKIEGRLPQNEKSSENEKENFRQSEMLLHTSVAKSETKHGFTPKTHGFLKSALVQADGAISRILKNFSKKQNASKFENGFSTKNIYQSRPELIPAEVKQDRQARGTSKSTDKQEMKKQKPEDSNLILCKPDIKETLVETGQTPKDVLLSDKEVYAKAVTSSRPHKNINDIDTEEVNMLAERILKVLEKRMVIQKDRRGLR